MPRAKGPYTVVHADRISWTEVQIRDGWPKGGWRVATVHDGPHDVALTAAMLAASEQMYDALRDLVPLSKYVMAGLAKLMDQPNVTEDQRVQLTGAVGSAFEHAKAAIAAAETPAAQPMTAPPASDPTYEQLVHAMHEIRRIVGDGTIIDHNDAETMDGDAIEEIAAVLDGLQPERLKQEKVDAG